jgi:hypothetical protein
MSDVLIKLCGMRERTRRGNTGEGHFYLAGRLGNAKLLGCRNHKKQSDADPDWNFFITEPSPPRQDSPTRAAERGNAVHPAAREVAGTWSREQRDEHVRELAERFGPESEIPF